MDPQYKGEQLAARRPHVARHNLFNGSREHSGKIVKFQFVVNFFEVTFDKVEQEQLSLGQPKVNKVKFFLPFETLWNVHKPNFTLIPWGNPKLLGQKKSKR